MLLGSAGDLMVWQMPVVCGPIDECMRIETSGSAGNMTICYGVWSVCHV